MMRRLHLACVASLVTATGYAQLAVAPIDSATLSSGIDSSSFDRTVRPQDDFFRYTQGSWLKSVDIPADRSSWGAFNIASELVEEQLRTIIESAAPVGAAPGSDAQLVGDFYASFMNEERRESLGLAPLKDELTAITALNSRRGVAAQIARLERLGVATPYKSHVHQDNRNSTQYVVDISQSGLGLPNRDFYLKLDDQKMADTRLKYREYLRKLLTLAGHEDAAVAAEQVLKLETDIARVQWSEVDNRDPLKAYNKLSIVQLRKLAPGQDWATYRKAIGAAGTTDFVIVSQPSYLQRVDAIMHRAPLSVLRAYFEVRLLNSYAPFLSQALVAEHFAFNGTVLTGAPANRSLQKRATATVNDGLTEVVGKIYVQRYFPEQRKRRVEAMAQNFLEAFRQSIVNLDWMTPTTKQAALLKLSKMSVKVGYPNRWRDYSSLRVASDDLVGNVMRARQFEHEYEFAKLGHPIDRDEWHMSPQTVNAYYNPEMNEIVFPAARLQVPLYDDDAEPAINYGAVGISIGHEISHAFDDQGSHYDGDGNLHNWWSEVDRERFAARTKLLVSQYNGYSPVPGYTINGELTLGENIADNAGAIMTLRAYKIALAGNTGPVIDGWTAEQRVFIGIAQARRAKTREARQIALLKSDPHSPGEFRVNGSLRNHPGFYEAFSVKPGDQMYLAPEQRVTIW